MVRIRTGVVRMSEGEHHSTTILRAVTQGEVPKAASESYIREDWYRGIRLHLGGLRITELLVLFHRRQSPSREENTPSSRDNGSKK